MGGGSGGRNINYNENDIDVSNYPALRSDELESNAYFQFIQQVHTTEETETTASSATSNALIIIFTDNSQIRRVKAQMSLISKGFAT